MMCDCCTCDFVVSFLKCLGVKIKGGGVPKINTEEVSKVIFPGLQLLIDLMIITTDISHVCRCNHRSDHLQLT